MEAETRVVHLHGVPRIAGNNHKLREARKDSSLGSSEDRPGNT